MYVLLFNVLIMFSMQAQSSFYNLSFNRIDGTPINLSAFKGKKILLVNTASKCGFTPQLEDLQEMHRKYANQLVIIGFPSNEFAAQDPGSNTEIEGFCKKNYGVDFILSEKINVKKNDLQHPVYRWLTQKTLNQFKNSRVLWNFQKYLISENGELVKIIRPWRSPKCKFILQWLESK